MPELTLLHFSDMHLGVETFGRLNPATGLSTRLEDYLAALDELVDVALNDKADLVLFTGDMYKNRDPSPTHQRELAKRIARLTAGGIPIFLLVGNHDLPNSPMRAHAIEVFDALTLNQVHVAGDIKLTIVETRNGPIQVGSLPWVPYSRMFRFNDYKNLTITEINGRIIDAVSRSVHDLTDKLDPSIPAVLAAHAHVLGAQVGSERSNQLGQDYILSIGDLWPLAWDYIALGHIHKYQVLSPADPPAVYAGSLQATDFGEEGEQKGYVRVTISPGGNARRPFDVHYTFVPSSSTRRFFTLKVNARTAGDPTQQVLDAIQRHARNISDAVVRVQVQLSPANEALLRDTEIRRALGTAFAVASISRQVERTDRTRFADTLIEQLEPRDALELFLKSKNVPEDRRKTLLDAADPMFTNVGQTS